MNEVDLTELNKLEEMLQEAGLPYRRIDDIGEAIPGIGYRVGEFHQIKVPSEGWDVICHHGSYGAEQGLLEAMGHKITGNNDVLGYLTAQEVMDRRGGENMLILEAKVRKGVKPVVTLDEHAKPSEVADATLNLIHAIFDRLEKQEENAGLFYLVRLAAKLQNDTDAW